jgi:tyrosine-protein phosphatase YwqE
MFSFFDRKEKKTFTLSTDLHSHLIPGIDDGAKDIEESLRLLQGLENLGYRKVITTPHIMSDCYRNNRDIIMDGLTYLRSEAKKAGINVLIEAAAEYYLDDGFYAHLEEGNLLTLGDDYLLFETSYVAKPLQFEEMVFAISTAGYKPLLAHPERYRYIHDFEKEYRYMKELGIFFQVNINSFGGHYGKDAQKKAEFLSKQGMIDFLGSDIHHYKQVETLGNIHNSKKYQNIFKRNTILNYTL